MFERPGPHVFALPIGTDFATQLVQGIKERFAGQPPDLLARTRLFVNSQRMLRRVTDAFVAAEAGFLPQMLVVTELDKWADLADFPAEISPLRRQLELAKLIDALLQTQPDLAPRSALFDLAESLATLLGEMQEEGVSTLDIARLDVANHSAHWARSLAFLQIIAPIFDDPADVQARQRLSALRLAEVWRKQAPDGPVIVAGSTGSRGATFVLMQAVARLDQGAIVLPGFDFDLPAKVWAAMDDGLTAEDHPQYRFRKLMAALDIPSDAVLPWRDAKPHNANRNKLISLSLRPAPVTDQWLSDGPDLPLLTEATADLTLIEAAGPREEAGAIALVLRHAVAAGQRAALITQDRILTRRVAAALDRWNIKADDTAGISLAVTPPGRLLRHVMAAMGQRLSAANLLTLLKHPLTGSGQNRGDHLRFSRELELTLRRHGPRFPQAADIVAWAKLRPDAGLGPWAENLAQVLTNLAEPTPAAMVAQLARHVALTEALVGGGAADQNSALWQGADGAAAFALTRAIEADAPFGGDMPFAAYCDLFNRMLRQVEVREAFIAHPQVAFYGHREAREMRADLVVMGGLTDGTWPAAGRPDPWLNRKMREDVGLLLPERQIGLAAHDYQQAVAAQTVVLSRALRDADAQTVPSRWLNRLCNLLNGLPMRDGPQALQAMQARGRAWLDLAARLEEPDAGLKSDPGLQPAKRPQPRPPVILRPKRLSLTRIATLIRDPYVIYAQFILNLAPLNRLNLVSDHRDRGMAIHKILERFAKERPDLETPAEARTRLMDLAKAILADSTPSAATQAFWLARMERAADHFLRQDRKHGGVTLHVEEKGSVRLEKSDFTLSGTPDRIDMLPDGRLHLIDYKTGAPPTAAQQNTFEKQLLLAAGMAERGGFARLGPTDVARITYIGLGAGDKAIETVVDPAMLDESWQRFEALIAAYGRLETGYTSRRAMFETRYPGDFDHLARFGEWQMSDRAVPVTLGMPDAKE